MARWRRSRRDRPGRRRGSAATVFPFRSPTTRHGLADDRRDDLVLDAPAKHPLDPLDAGVDGGPRQLGIDHSLADRLQVEGPEFRDGGLLIKIQQRFAGMPAIVIFAPWLSILQVVNLGEIQKRINQIGNRDLPGRLLDGPLVEFPGEVLANHTTVSVKDFGE